MEGKFATLNLIICLDFSKSMEYGQAFEISKERLLKYFSTLNDKNELIKNKASEINLSFALYDNKTFKIKDIGRLSEYVKNPEISDYQNRPFFDLGESNFEGTEGNILIEAFKKSSTFHDSTFENDKAASLIVIITDGYFENN